uniref:Uncharacterized protein n=1 Tax=Myotis myotis TaxID=51298 RepID=A0A7J7U5H2_MYOMY|nr:hypothetical protein mMyoMyo1_008853 [Myotis myotis]
MDRGGLITMLLLFRWGWAERGCCSLDRSGLFMWLLLLGWTWTVHVAAAPWIGAGCTLLLFLGWGRLLVRLPLFGQGQVAHRATAPCTSADCSRSCCSSDGGTGCMHGCCSSGGSELHVRLLLPRWGWDTHPAATRRTGADCVWLLLPSVGCAGLLLLRCGRSVCLCGCYSSDRGEVLRWLLLLGLE